MKGTKQRHFASLINVSVEELVPQDHFYRQLERTLDHTGRARVRAGDVCSRWSSVTAYLVYPIKKGT
jgi:hypothetical protein